MFCIRLRMRNALKLVVEIHLQEAPGDILVFLTGHDEIDKACDALADTTTLCGSKGELLEIFPVYAALPFDTQTKILIPAKDGFRKVVIATNIAETSLTIDGIAYVIDSGYVKQGSYRCESGTERLSVAQISQASAKQRTGRAGRTAKGKCFRLYSQSTYNRMSPTTVPEIQRVNLVNVVMLLKAMGIKNLMNFDFLVAPLEELLINALEQLHSVGKI